VRDLQYLHSVAVTLADLARFLCNFRETAQMILTLFCRRDAKNGIQFILSEIDTAR